ncbi:subtilisin-like protein [Ascobolus immersus RN42]|uniref:Subtilisin-like protein n=1 Tax=Ascobolus immersus RN42 TaxID=1160509 RepID=A0A3N4IF81_ASCIM|nr:subtilisin-like protein [Ascobolus immersus RN42]
MGATTSTIYRTFDNGVFRGFIGNMSHHCVKQMGVMSVVKTFEKDSEFQAKRLVEQSDAPWGLQRISSGGPIQNPPNNLADVTSRAFSYQFDDTVQGEGVDVYVIDSGVNAEHVAFGGRAQNIFEAPRLAATDDNGHGTHCAGTVASEHFGVAKKANIFGVKVLNAAGGGRSSDIIAGLDVIVQSHRTRSATAGFKGSVMSMSLGNNGISQVIDNAVKLVSNAGIHVAVAAGNESKDACLVSPGNLGTNDGQNAIVSVGAIDINERRPNFSNFGSCISVYAPGVQVLSTFIQQPQQRGANTNNFITPLSGTSMATPHVAGLMAVLISENPELGKDPLALKNKIIADAQPAATLRDVAGDPAIVVNNGIGSRRPAPAGLAGRRRRQ